MKKLLCAVLLGALTLVPSYSATIGSETIQIKKVFLYAVVGPITTKCHYNWFNAKTGELWRADVVTTVFTPSRCPI